MEKTFYKNIQQVIDGNDFDSDNSFFTKTAYDDLVDESKISKIFKMSNMSISKHLKRLVFKNGSYHVNPKFDKKKYSVGSAYHTLKKVSANEV